MQLNMLHIAMVMAEEWNLVSKKCITVQWMRVHEDRRR